MVEFSLEEILLDDPLGLLAEPKAKIKTHTQDERLITSFNEINDFFERNGREPAKSIDMNERAIFSRLQGLREHPEKIDALKSYDRFGLLQKIDINSIDDILNDDAYGLLGDDKESIFELKHIPKTKETNMPEYIAARKPCKDFDKYKKLFIDCQNDIKTKKRTLIKFQNEQQIKRGYYFVLNGVLLYVADVGAIIKSGAKTNARLRLIFENGTESDMLLRSLSAELYKHGKRVGEYDEKALDGLYEVGKDDEKSGFIYILESLSADEKISQIKDLYKIGYSTVDVRERIKNAANEPTYLMAPVRIYSVYECYNMNAQKFEHLIHKFFGKARLNIDIFGDEGRRYNPREWFVAPVDIIEQAIELIINGEIIDYRFDETSGSMTPFA